MRQLGASLEGLGAIAPAESDNTLPVEAERRLSERRERVYQGILDRYRTRDLVARYDGAVQPEDRDTHLPALTHRSSRWYSSQVLSAKKALISKSIADM